MTFTSTTVFWDTLQHGDWMFHLAATDRGLCCVTLPNETFDTLKQWVKKHVPEAVLTHEQSRMGPYLEQIEEYLIGQRTSFTVPVDLRGTAFQVRVWHALVAIPYGSTQKYSEIAADIGHPSAVRAVGAANGANPLPVVVPCHRVIGKDGTLTGYRGGLDMKAELLKLERAVEENSNSKQNEPPLWRRDSSGACATLTRR